MMPTSEEMVRSRILAKSADYYQPEDLADAFLALLEFMECVCDKRIPGGKFRKRAGIYNAAFVRNSERAWGTENAITLWLAEFFPNAESQVRGLAKREIPDIVLGYKEDSFANDVLVIVEAKPIWKRWISAGLRTYKGEVVDSVGRATGPWCERDCQLLLKDRDKVLKRYTHPHDRVMLLALVFQRPGELDTKLISLIGPGWSVRSRHVIDRSNPPGDNIGLTGMVFWPMRPAVMGAAASIQV